MKTSAGTNATAGVGFAQRFISQVMHALGALLQPAAKVQHSERGNMAVRRVPVVAPQSGSAKPAAMLMAAAAFTFVFVALLAPRAANAMSGYVSSVTANHTSSNLVNMCSNCHADWGGTGIGNAMRIDYNLWSAGGGANPVAGSNFYLTDGDMDGISTGDEYLKSEDATKPAQSTAAPNPLNNWFPNYPDKDGDGCIQLHYRASESGRLQWAFDFAAQAIVNSKGNYTKFAQNGWDIDDNDPLQGCSATATASAPGTTTDSTPPAAISDFSVGSTPASGSIPLKWTAVGDDGMTGNAHDYDLRFTTEALASGNQLRNPASWTTLRESNGVELKDLTWNTGGLDAPLMRAVYEPVPSTPGNLQSCTTALGFSALCTANPGASYVLASKGTGARSTNVLTNGTVYWLAVWTGDGVIKPVSGTANEPCGAGIITCPAGSFTENTSLSNIIAVTAGPAGTSATSGVGISSISPTTLTGATSPATVTVTGYGLNANANQVVNMYLTGPTGNAIALATGLSCNGTSCTGVFTAPIANGTYNLELRNGTGTANTKAAWVNAITVNNFTGGVTPPSLTSASPNARGQGAANQNITLSGADFGSTGGDVLTASFSNPGITVNSTTRNSTISATANITVGAGAATGAGTVTISLNGGTASNTTAFSVTAAPTITSAAPTVGYINMPFSLTATAINGVTPYTWSATGLAAAGLSINATSGLISGTPPATGTFGGSITVTDANAGTTTQGFSIVISKTNQTIGAVTFTPATLVFGGTTTVSATASSGLTVTFASSTPAVCTVTGTTVTAVAAGTCTIVASQPGDATYNAATPVNQNIIVAKADQTIVATCPTTLTFNASGTCSGTASSGLTVTFTSTTPTFCTTSGTNGTTVTATSTAGTCVIAANQAGNTNYNAAPTVNKSIAVSNVALTPQNITGFSCGSLVVNGSTTCSATGGGSGNPVTFSSNTPGVCTTSGINGSTVTAQHAGTCTIAADQAGNATYAAATTVTTSVIVAKADQTIGTVTFTPATLQVGGTTTVSATASSGLAVTFSSLTTGVCTVVGSTVTAVSGGTCTIAANQAGNADYNAALQVTGNIIVAKADQTIGTVTFTPATLSVGTTTVASATASSGLTVTFTSTTPTVCTVVGSTVTGVSVGTCTIAANQAGNAAYNPAPQVTQNIAVTDVPGAPTIGTCTVISGSTASCTFTPPVSDGGSPITSYTATCPSSDGGATGLGAGLASPVSVSGLTSGKLYTCTVVATNGVGNSAPSAASNSFTPIDLDPIAPNITVTPPGGTYVSAQSVVFSTDKDATVYYTLDGSVPTTASTSCSATPATACPAINISSTTTLRYFGANLTGTPGALGLEIYTINSVNLVMTQVAPVGTSVHVGKEFTVNNTEANTGSSDMTTNSNAVRFYLSLNTTYESSDTMLFGSNFVPKLLAGTNSGSTATVVKVLTATEPGNYYVIACADANNTEAETNELDNCLASTATIQVIRDVNLVMTEVSPVGPSANVGGTLVVSNTEANTGGTDMTVNINVVKFYLSTDNVITSGDIALSGARYVPAIAAGGNSGSEATSVTVPRAMTPGTYYVGACADNFTVQIESNEADNCLSSVGTIQIIRDVDLIVKDISIPALATVAVGGGVANSTINVTNTVRNQGSTDMTVGITVVRYYLSADNVITSSDTQLSGARFVTSIPALTDSTTEATVVSVPKSVAPGFYYVGACVDAAHTQDESNELNNCLATTTTVEAVRDVNLVMTEVAPAVTSVQVGNAFAVNNTEANNGATNMTVNINVTKFYLSLDQVKDSSDILLSGSRYVSAIAALSNSGSEATSVTVARNTEPGNYYVIACADTFNAQVGETSETDNCMASALPVQVTRDVNLQMASVEPVEASAQVAGSFTVNSVEANVGPTDMTVNINVVRFYLTTNNVSDTGSMLSGSAYNTAIAGLSNTGSVITSVTVPKSVAPGTYYVRACADAYDVQAESNETDNCKYSVNQITIVRAVDLVMTEVSPVGLSADVGGGLVVNNTVTNQGTTDMTVNISVVRFYLSTDNVITTGDIQLSGARFVPALAANTGSGSEATQLTVPRATAPGFYYVGACADAASVQVETNELNNCTSSLSTIEAIRNVDLVMSAVSTLATSVAVGGSFSIENTEANIGSTGMTIMTNKISFYLSTDAVITTSDKPLMGARYVSLLDALTDSGNASTIVTVPANTPPGTYYIGAIADVNDSQPETNESNNALAGLQITITP